METLPYDTLNVIFSFLDPSIGRLLRHVFSQFRVLIPPTFPAESVENIDRPPVRRYVSTLPVFQIRASMLGLSRLVIALLAWI